MKFINVRTFSAVTILVLSAVTFTTSSGASNLPSGAGVTTLVNSSLDVTKFPSGLIPLVAASSTAVLPCVTTIVSGAGVCSASSGVSNDGNGGQLLLADGSSGTPNVSGVSASSTFPSNSALYAEFDTQSYGNGGGGRTIWFQNGSFAAPTLPSASDAEGYGSLNGGIPGAVLGVSLDSAGLAALTNAPSCPAVGWDSSKASSNAVVVRGGDTSQTGSTGYCFVASTDQPIGSLSTSTSKLGPLHQASATDGWQHVFVAVLPPSFTRDTAQLTVAVDAADGRGLRTVLDIALPTWVWATDGSNFPATLRFGISGANPAGGAANDVMAIRELHAVAVAPTPVAPDAPRNFGIQVSAPSNGLVSATLSWSAPAFIGYSPITSYLATMNGQTCSPATFSTPVLSCVITNIPAGDTYSASVTATNAAGDSVAAVAQQSVSPQTQTITMAALGNVTFGASPQRLSATASSGLVVSFLASGSCSYANSLLTFTQAGTCTVTATQSGTMSFAAATPVVRTLIVNPATVTIKASPISVVADGTAHPVVATTNPPSIPVTISYCPATSLTTCTPTAPSETGSYVATVTPASPNYNSPAVATTVALLPNTTALPPDAGGPTTGTNSNVATQLDSSSSTPAVATTGSGFTPGATVAISVTGQETLGSFTIPDGTNATALSGLMTPSSSSTTVQSPTVQNATNPTELSSSSTIAFPFGGFPGAGSYIMVPITSSGFVPGSTVSSTLHSSPLILATAIADANGNVTIVVPIPAAFAGQSHKLLIAGTYLASTTVANPDGSVSASTAIPADLLSRLEPGSQIVVTAIDQANPSVFAKSYIPLANITNVTTTTVAGSANDVLNAPPLVPTEHPAQTMKQLTNLVAVAATVAATASVAASVAGSVGSIRVPTGGAPRPAGGSSSSSSGPLSTQQIGTAVDEATLEVEKRGDQSRLWRTPGHSVTDTISIAGPHKVAPISPMLAAVISDGSYLRAMFGALSGLTPILGLIFGIFNVVQTHGYPVPGQFVTFSVLMVLGALDGWAGLTSSLAVLVGAATTGHLYSLNMLVSFSLMAALLFGTPVIVKGVRPLIRQELSGVQGRWKRAGDIVVGPLFGGFLVTQLVGAAASASGLDLPITKHALDIGIAVGVALFVRYVLSTFAVVTFPKRLSHVTVDHLDDQHHWAKHASQIIRQVFTALLLQAFLGWSWVLALLVTMQVLQAVVAPKITKQWPNWAYRLVPRGVVNMFFMAVVGTLGGRIMSHYVTSGFWQVAGLLIALTAVNMVYAILASFEGEGIPVTWLTRIAGVGAVVITGLQLTGRLI